MLHFPSPQPSITRLALLRVVSRPKFGLVTQDGGGLWMRGGHCSLARGALPLTPVLGSVGCTKAFCPPRWPSGVNRSILYSHFWLSKGKWPGLRAKRRDQGKAKNDNHLTKPKEDAQSKFRKGHSGMPEWETVLRQVCSTSDLTSPGQWFFWGRLGCPISCL